MTYQPQLPLTPVLSVSDASPLELQVMAYRDRWTARKVAAALSCNMRAVSEAQDHIDAAGKELVKIAAGVQ